MKYFIAMFLLLFLISCGANEQENIAGEIVSSETAESKIIESETIDAEENELQEFKEKEAELNLDNSEIVQILLNSENTTSNNDAVEVSGQVITITKSWNYELSGTLSNGQIIIDSDGEDDVQVILNNADITNSQWAAIYVKNAEQAVITLADDSSNVLTDGENYSDEGEDSVNATLFSTEDMVIQWSGTLTVHANYNDGITSKDNLFINGWNINVISVDDGIRWKDYLAITNGKISVTAEGDALKSDNEDEWTIFIDGGKTSISAGDDGINASKYITINSGDIDITKSFEGIEAYIITVNGWNINIVSSDDNFNAAGWEEAGITGQITGLLWWESSSGWQLLTINGGNITLDAGWDSLDSNADTIVTGWNIIIHWTSQGGSVLDYNGTFTMSGWDLIALGSGQRAQVPTSESTQNTIIIHFDEAVPTWTDFTIIDENNTELASITSRKDYKYMIFSNSELELWKTYSYTMNGEIAWSVEINGVVSTLWELVSNKR